MVRRTTISLATALLLQPSPSIGAQVVKLYPVDEAAHDSSFLAFRQGFLDAVNRRDTTAIFAALAPSILNSLGGDGGIDEFRTMWFGGAKRDIWGTLRGILSLGGAFYKDSLFIAPYTSAKFPRDLDPLAYGAVVGANVRVRQAPRTGSAIVATLTYDVVRVEDWQHADETGRSDLSWVRIRLRDETQGFVAQQYIRSPIGYRAGFVKRGTRWLMTTLVAGD